jgi:hypothetical protein
MDQVFAELATKHPQARFVRVEAEEVSEITEKHDVAAVPHVLFFKVRERPPCRPQA